MMMSMDLYMFPFDCQNLQIGVKPNKKDITEVVLASGERSINMILRQEWDVVGHLCRAYHTDPSTSSSTKVYSSMHIIVLVRRESGWYVKNIMLPTVAMVILNYTVYAFPLDEVGARMEIAVGLVLATAVNKIVVSDKLAKVPYQTFIDRFQGACFYYQLFLGIQMPAIYLAYVGIEHNVAFWLNIILFLSSAILFFALCYSFTQSLTRHLTDVDVCLLRTMTRKNHRLRRSSNRSPITLLGRQLTCSYAVPRTAVAAYSYERSPQFSEQRRYRW